MNKKPVYYSQVDSKWKNVPYTIDGDKNETIGYSGCGPTSMAMVLATWVNKGITPPVTAGMAIQLHDRTADNGTSWKYFGDMAQKFKLGFLQTNKDQIAWDALKDGALVICSMGPGHFTKSGHFILAWDYDGKKLRVNDPISKIRTMQSWDKEIFHEEARQYFIFRKVVK